MIVFRDLVTGDELFSDAYPVKNFKMDCESDDCDDETFVVSCEAKMEKVMVGGGISADLIGGNPSQEEQCDDLDDSAQCKQDLNLVNNFGIKDQSDFFTSKKALASYVKKWIKNVPAKIEDENKREKFKKDCGKKLKAFIDLWQSESDVSIYTGESFDPGEAASTPMIGVWSADGMSVTMYVIKESIIEEKC